MKKIKGKFRLVLYGLSGIGVNMLNLIVTSYLIDATMIEGFEKNVENWTFFNKTIVVAGIWSIIIAISKVLDGVIDLPFASFTDNLKTKFGKRRPAILMGLIPMVLAYVGILNPLQNVENSIINTIWLGVMICIFYSFYTLTMVTYYATFSEIVDNDEDRLHLSNYKTIFDVIYFVMGYALVPAFVGFMNIRLIGYLFLPMVLTMLIPLFMIKEKSTRPEDIEKEKLKLETNQEEVEPEEKHVNLWKSMGYAFKNKSFIVWMIVYATLQFALQLFLTGQNVLYSGTMGFIGIKITIVMACAFAPVPFTLILYNKIVKKLGLNVGYRFSLIMFMIAMILMGLCNTHIIPNEIFRLVLCCIGAVFASFGIGCFFSISYTVPSTISEIEKKKTGVSHPAMYFAIQGLVSGIAVAISTGIVWVNLKDVADGKFIWLMPIIVIVGGLVSFGLTFLLPREINEIGKKVKKAE